MLESEFKFMTSQTENKIIRWTGTILIMLAPNGKRIMVKLTDFQSSKLEFIAGKLETYLLLMIMEVLILSLW